MKTITQITLITLVILLMSCTSRIKKSESTSTSNGQNLKVKIFNSDSLSKQTVFDFYQWYVNDIYLKRIDTYRIAPYKKYGMNKYGLDLDIYKNRLDSVRFFSCSFKSFLIQRSKICSHNMLKETWDSNPEYEGSFNIPSCTCRWNNEWFGNQEDENNKFTILDDFVKEGDTYIYTVQTYMYDTPMFQFEVKTVLEGQQYKIGFIQKK